MSIQKNQHSPTTKLPDHVSEKSSPKNVNERKVSKTLPLKDNSTKAISAPKDSEARRVSITKPVTKKRNLKEPNRTSLPQPTTKVVNQTKPGLTVPTKIPKDLKLRSPQSQFNTMRIPSSTSVGLQEKIQSRLRKKSPWYDSITSPITGGGVKIPDPIGTDTGTYQHIQNVSVSVNAGGVCGLRVVSPYINEFDGSTPTGVEGSNFQISNASASTTNVTWGDGVTNPGWMYPFATIPALMRANARSHRVVSACVIAQPEISTLADAGEMCAFVTPFACQSDSATSVIPYPQYQAAWDSSMIPVNAHKPVIARWYPLESEYDLFTGSASVSTDDSQQISYRDFIQPSNVDEPGVIPWEFGVVCKGMTPSTGVVRFQIIVNYEFIPLLSTAMVAVDASPVDPMEEQLVNHWISMDPVTQVISQKEASKSATTTKVAGEPTGFGMLFNVIEEMMPTLVSALPKLLNAL